MVSRLQASPLVQRLRGGLTFCLTRANVNGRDARAWNVSVKEFHGKVLADRGHGRRELFEELSDRGIHPVHGLKADMRNGLMSIRDRILPRKRHILECIDGLLKNKADLVHSRRRLVRNFLMNICPALTVYCFFETNLRHCPYMSKGQGNSTCSNWCESLSRTCVFIVSLVHDFNMLSQRNHEKFPVFPLALNFSSYFCVRRRSRCQIWNTERRKCRIGARTVPRGGLLTYSGER